MNRQIKRALGTAVALSLGLTGLVGIAAPAQAAASTTFKIHLNVPKEIAEGWNIWHWNGGVDSKNNTIGESTQVISGTPWTGDSTPNFVGEDAYGAYAEFTFPVAITALNNVLRTTESWDGQEATDAVADDPSTPDTDETVAAKPAIPASDKPFGGDNIFPAGESWWNIHTGKREYPAVASYKVHVNMPLKTAQSQGWNLYSWNTTVGAPVLKDYVVSTSKVVTTIVKKKPVKKTVVTKTYPYKGKVKADTTGWPFVGEDKYGAYAIVKTMDVYSDNAGLVLRRSQPDNDWAGVQLGDYKYTDGLSNGLPRVGTEMWLTLGVNEAHYSVPTFVGRYGATGTYSAGTLTVTPVRPSHPSMKGMFPTKITVTAKKGPTTKTCTIQSNVTQATFAGASMALPSSCGMAVAASPDEDQTWEVYVQAESVVGKGPGATDKPNARVIVPKS
ncbi:MAG: hypothetical protein ACOYKO_03315 [Rhodoluna sp.]